MIYPHNRLRKVLAKILFLIFCFLFAVSCFIYLDRSGVFFFSSWRAPLTDIRSEIGFACIALTNHPELSSHEQPSPARILENGVPLPGPGNALHDDVRNFGGGRFCFWHDYVYFSSSDNSDPRFNGRSYEVCLPFIVSKWPAWLCYCVTFSLCVVLVVQSGRARGLIRRFISEPPLWCSVLIIVSVFLITRLPFFVHYPVVGIAPDTRSYVVLANQILNDQVWPSFAVRMPGYPLFIWLITSFADRWLAVVAVQSAISLASGLCLIYGVYRFWRLLSLPAAVALAGWLGSSQVLFYEIHALGESLYTSCLVFSFAFLLLGISLRRLFWFVLSSFAMACTILVRPAGMFLLVVYVLVLAFMMRNAFTRRAILSFAIPLLAIILVLGLYNYMTIHAFALSKFGEWNLALATISYWETDPAFPPEVNSAIEELPATLAEQVGFTDQDRKIINASWDYKLLVTAFAKVYLSILDDWVTGRRFGDKYFADESPDNGSAQEIACETVASEKLFRAAYMKNRPLIRRICLTAMRKHPDLYLKYVLANMLYYYWENINLRFDFYKALTSIATTYYIEKPYSNGGQLAGCAFVAKEYAHSPPPDKVDVFGSGDDTKIVLADSGLRSIHSSFQSWQWRWFQHRFWVCAYFVVFLLSNIKLIASKGRHQGAFVLFVLTVSVFGASLLACLVEIGLERYAYPMQFAYYLSVVLLPTLFTREKVAPESGTANAT